MLQQYISYIHFLTSSRFVRLHPEKTSPFFELSPLAQSIYTYRFYVYYFTIIRTRLISEMAYDFL
ncbi:hypothetical protein CW304_15340 [Bacillus sp. UFRGS-B20]|nr:hypothetical protein CW304_15340 [Bacillus sp. UFRGS-B20]